MSMTRLNPYLNFAGEAREAMEFYRSVLGGELEISTFAEYGGAPEGLSDDGVMHAMLKTDAGFVLMASDAPGGVTRGTNIAISLSGTDAEELRGYWAGLSADGEVSVPLEMQMWGDEYGSLIDRFGVSWMVNIAGSAVEGG